MGSQSLGCIPRAEAAFPCCLLTCPLSGFGVATVRSVNLAEEKVSRSFVGCS